MPRHADVDALVVGAGPNGLAAAVTLARAGIPVRVYEAMDTIGGGCRTEEATLPGFRHDLCSAIHPFGIGSPFFDALPLAEHGLEWVHPDLAVVHPLDGGRVGFATRALDDMVTHFGRDGSAYQELVQPFAEAWDSLAPEFMGPFFHRPSHPLVLARFGVRAVWSAERLAHRFSSEEVRALWAGLAIHAIAPPDRFLTGGMALAFAAAIHARGWPAARGGTAAITEALAAHLRELGGEIVTGCRIRSMEQLPPARAVLFDVMPGALARIAGDRLPARYRRRLERYRHGPGVFKVDYALSEPVPWEAEVCRRAGTVHLGGTLEEITVAEDQVRSGRPADRPVMVVAQQSLFDDIRAPSGQHTLWAYAHVPHGYTGDATDTIDGQIERFAPGFRDVVLARATRGPAVLEADNPNLVGGDIAGGSAAGLQALFRPMFRLVPYATPDPSVYLCSSATPPGGGVHGMCGHRAAQTALRRTFGR